MLKTSQERLLDNGYEDIVIFKDESYDDALIGVSHDGRAIYSFEKMIAWLVKRDGMTETDAIEWIEYNTIRAIPYFGNKAPIVLYELNN